MALQLPPEVVRLYLDVDPSTGDLAKNADDVTERLMPRGGWEAMRWLRANYPLKTLADFIVRKRRTRLSSRELAYGSLVAGLPDEPGPGGARPPWAGP